MFYSIFGRDETPVSAKLRSAANVFVSLFVEEQKENERCRAGEKSHNLTLLRKALISVFEHGRSKKFATPLPDSMAASRSRRWRLQASNLKNQVPWLFKNIGKLKSPTLCGFDHTPENKELQEQYGNINDTFASTCNTPPIAASDNTTTTNTMSIDNCACGDLASFYKNARHLYFSSRESILRYTIGEVTGPNSLDTIDHYAPALYTQVLEPIPIDQLSEAKPVGPLGTTESSEPCSFSEVLAGIYSCEEEKEICHRLETAATTATNHQSSDNPKFVSAGEEDHIDIGREDSIDDYLNYDELNEIEYINRFVNRGWADPQLSESESNTRVQHIKVDSRLKFRRSKKLVDNVTSVDKDQLKVCEQSITAYSVPLQSLGSLSEIVSKSKHANVEDPIFPNVTTSVDTFEFGDPPLMVPEVIIDPPTLPCCGERLKTPFQGREFLQVPPKFQKYPSESQVSIWCSGHKRSLPAVPTVEESIQKVQKICFVTAPINWNSTTDFQYRSKKHVVHSPCNMEQMCYLLIEVGLGSHQSFQPYILELDSKYPIRISTAPITVDQVPLMLGKLIEYGAISLEEVKDIYFRACPVYSLNIKEVSDLGEFVQHLQVIQETVLEDRGAYLGKWIDYQCDGIKFYKKPYSGLCTTTPTSPNQSFFRCLYGFHSLKHRHPHSSWSFSLSRLEEHALRFKGKLMFGLRIY